MLRNNLLSHSLGIDRILELCCTENVLQGSAPRFSTSRSADDRSSGRFTSPAGQISSYMLIYVECMNWDTVSLPATLQDLGPHQSMLWELWRCDPNQSSSLPSVERDHTQLVASNGMIVQCDIERIWEQRCCALYAIAYVAQKADVCTHRRANDAGHDACL
jgi:hypothetical protein